MPEVATLPGQLQLPLKTTRIAQAFDVFCQSSKPLTANEVARICVAESPEVLFDTFRRLAAMLFTTGDVIDAGVRTCDVTGCECRAFTNCSRKIRPDGA